MISKLDLVHVEAELLHAFMLDEPKYAKACNRHLMNALHIIQSGQDSLMACDGDGGHCQLKYSPEALQLMCECPRCGKKKK